jgi:hypothetical protein
MNYFRRQSRNNTEPTLVPKTLDLAAPKQPSTPDAPPEYPAPIQIPDPTEIPSPVPGNEPIEVPGPEQNPTPEIAPPQEQLVVPQLGSSRVTRIIIRQTRTYPKILIRVVEPPRLYQQ